MNDKGEVGEIGGIRLKMLGAKRDGATWFLAPESNCSSVVDHIPEGLNVVKVSTLQEAYDALVAVRDGKGASCRNAPRESDAFRDIRKNNLAK